jgi:NADH:ubiquinone oxidoreductase subunit 6 (subunit J)
MNIEAILFYAFAVLTITGAIGVAFCSHIVRAAVQLLFALVGVSGLYFMLRAEFLAAVQLVIYVGGTLVLMIFGVMLTSRASTRLLLPTRTERTLGIASGIACASVLAVCIGSTQFAYQPLDQLPDETRALGIALLGKYLLAFEVASLLLLAVMLGAAYLARKDVQKGGAL